MAKKFRLDGSLIRDARESAGKRREAVAVEVGVSAAYISMIELGYRRPPMETLAAVCRAVGIPVDVCFVEDDEVPA